MVVQDKIVHGSKSNKSPDERKSIVLGVRHNVKEFDKKVYKRATIYRRNFIVDNLQKIVDKHKSQDMYLDFNKKSEY